MVKADDKVCFDDEKVEKEKFSNFEFLKVEVEVLKETVSMMVDILRDNNLHKTEKIIAEYFDDNEVHRKLEENN